MSQATASSYKSPLHEMTQSTPTCLWNDSASVEELSYSIQHGAVGATCNPVIVLGVLKKEINDWKGRIHALIHEFPTATEDELAWQLVREISMRAATLLKPIFDEHHGKNGRLSIQTDPRLFRDSDAILKQAAPYFESEAVRYFGGLAYFVILNSLIMRVPLGIKPMLWPIVKPVLFGWVPVGLVSGLISYFIVRAAVAAYQHRRSHRLAQRRLHMATLPRGS